METEPASETSLCL